MDPVLPKVGQRLAGITKKQERKKGLPDLESMEMGRLHHLIISSTRFGFDFCFLAEHIIVGQC